METAIPGISNGALDANTNISLFEILRVHCWLQPLHFHGLKIVITYFRVHDNTMIDLSIVNYSLITKYVYNNL